MIWILLFAVVSAFGEVRSNLPSPYNTVDILPFDPQGWYSNQHGIQYLIHKHEVKTVIEVGSWLGASTRHIAELLPEGGKVYAVDHWLGSIEHQEGGSSYSPHLPHLYEQFLSNVIHTNLTHKIIPVRMDSLRASAYLSGVKPDLVYIDAGHDTESVYADLQAWFPFVKGHGILCGDDWFWETVRIAVRAFAEEQNLEIFYFNNFWRVKER